MAATLTTIANRHEDICSQDTLLIYYTSPPLQNERCTYIPILHTHMQRIPDHKKIAKHYLQSLYFKQSHVSKIQHTNYKHNVAKAQNKSATPLLQQTKKVFKKLLF